MEVTCAVNGLKGTIYGDNMFAIDEPIPFLVNGFQFIIPNSWITDFATVPRFLWSIFPPLHRDWLAASIIHDYLYFNHDYLAFIAEVIQWEGDHRKLADTIFYYAINEKNWRRKPMYWAVRVFGNKPFKDVT